MSDETVIVSAERIEQSILLIRGQKVLLDAELVDLYGVETRVLIQAVKRNPDRFPADFMFRLSDEEFSDLRSQSVTSSQWGGRRYAPYAFTEQEIAMLSSVLRSGTAIRVNIAIMRAFVRLREMLRSHEDPERRLDELEQKYDSQFQAVFQVLRKLTEGPKPTPQRPIGFRTPGEKDPADG